MCGVPSGTPLRLENRQATMRLIDRLHYAFDPHVVIDYHGGEVVIRGTDLIRLIQIREEDYATRLTILWGCRCSGTHERPFRLRR